MFCILIMSQCETLVLVKGEVTHVFKNKTLDI